MSDQMQPLVVAQVDEDHLKEIEEKLSRPPKRLTTSSGNKACCIFKIPPIFHDFNSKSYIPQTISIGPYHRGQRHLDEFEEHKWLYLGSMLERRKSHGVELKDLMRKVSQVEMEARACYSQVVPMERKEFVEMMLLDGCFILELFRKVTTLVSFDESDPIHSMPWVMAFLARDFLKLENQIPYFILEILFCSSRDPVRETRATLPIQALVFFSSFTHRQFELIVERFAGLKGTHLLDLVRLSYVDQFFPNTSGEQAKTQKPYRQIFNVTKLRKSGVKMKKSEEDSFLMVKFKKGTLLMPEITIDDFMGSFLLNCVAYEQCQSEASNHFTSYTNLLDCLVNTASDVEHLCDRNIFDNYFGSNEEVAQFINNLGHEVTFSTDNCYLSQVFDDVNQFCHNERHVQWAGFKYTYFRSPWSFISALSAAILLLLTLAQTFFTIYGVYKS